MAMPEVVLGTDNERGFFVVVEGAKAQEVLAVALEGDTGPRVSKNRG